MSKKKESNPLPPEGIEHPATPPAPPVADKKPVYDFGRGKRCPGCRGTDTWATSTQGGIQYRQCRRVGCRYYHRNYSIIGKEI